MSITSTSAYTAGNYYNQVNESSSSTKSTSAGSTNKSDETDTTPEYKITFSSELSTARIQEAMGLEPTGKLKLKDLETVAEDREELVTSILTQTMESLGIDPDEEISLYLGAENEICVSGNFPEKSSLEEALNSNENFTVAFKQLTANQSMVDYIEQLQSSVENRTESLMDYFNSDTDLNDLLSLAAEYKNLKSSSNIMGTLLDLSSSQTPYTYTYDNGAE